MNLNLEEIKQRRLSKKYSPRPVESGRRTTIKHALTPYHNNHHPRVSSGIKSMFSGLGRNSNAVKSINDFQERTRKEKFHKQILKNVSHTYEKRIIKEQMAILDRQLQHIPQISFDPKHIEAKKKEKVVSRYEIVAKDKAKDSNFHIATAKVHERQNLTALPEVEQRRISHLTRVKSQIVPFEKQIAQEKVIKESRRITEQQKEQLDDLENHMDTFKEMMQDFHRAQETGEKAGGVFDQNYKDAVEKEREKMKHLNIDKRQEKFREKWGAIYSKQYIDTVIEISSNEKVTPQAAKMLMLERGINMKKDYVGEVFKNYKFWGEFKLQTASTALPSTEIVKKPQNSKMTQHLLQQVLANKIVKKVVTEAKVQNVRYESPYGKLGQQYNKFVGSPNKLSGSRSVEMLKPIVPAKNKQLNAKMEKQALYNFENFHKLEQGSATRAMLEISEAGVKGWANVSELLAKAMKANFKPGDDPAKLLLDNKTRVQLQKTRQMFGISPILTKEQLLLFKGHIATGPQNQTRTPGLTSGYAGDPNQLKVSQSVENLTGYHHAQQFDPYVYPHDSQFGFAGSSAYQREMILKDRKFGSLSEQKQSVDRLTAQPPKPVRVVKHKISHRKHHKKK